jgi:hypothetical protein
LMPVFSSSTLLSKPVYTTSKIFLTSNLQQIPEANAPSVIHKRKHALRRRASQPWQLQ